VRGGEASGEIGYRCKVCQIEHVQTDFGIRELVADFRDRFAAFGFVPAGQHYLRSRLREPYRGLIAEAAGRSGDYGKLAPLGWNVGNGPIGHGLGCQIVSIAAKVQRGK
jgi:hypothetical protein